MILFFKAALDDWILSSSIYNAIHLEVGNNINNVGLMMIDGDKVISLNAGHPDIEQNENLTIIAHGNNDGDFCDKDGNVMMSMTMLRDLLLTILPDNFTGTIRLRACYSGKNGIGSQKIYSMTHRIYELLRYSKPDLNVKGTNGPNVDYIDFNNIWHELCVNPTMEDVAGNISRSLESPKFKSLRITYPTDLNTLYRESEKIAKETRSFFVEFAKSLSAQNCLLTANPYNYWSKDVEGQM